MGACKLTSPAIGDACICMGEKLTAGGYDTLYRAV
jgi:hypothetical protein